MRCALVVGHKSSSPGAVNATQSLSEFEFNARLAVDIWKRFYESRVELVIVWRRTYGTLAADVNEVDPVLVVSMHANASHSGTASGTETLYYHRSKWGKEIAGGFQNHFVSALGLPDRGTKPRTREDRGGGFLGDVAAPAVLCEPFFIDNDSDLERATDIDLAGVYVSAITEGLSTWDG